MGGKRALFVVEYAKQAATRTAERIKIGSQLSQAAPERPKARVRADERIEKVVAEAPIGGTAAREGGYIALQPSLQARVGALSRRKPRVIQEAKRFFGGYGKAGLASTKV